MKFLDVLWGLRLCRTEQELALALRMLPSAHTNRVGVRVVCFRRSIAHPAYSPVYASPCTSRCPTQNSGRSGSLLLSLRNFHSLLHTDLSRPTNMASHCRHHVKTTLEIPDFLFRRANSVAAERGIPLRQFVPRLSRKS